MTESQRHLALLKLLEEKKTISVSSVIEQFQVSPATARRDINKLDELGKLRKVRNGAEALPSTRTYWSPMNIHEALNHDEKARIVRQAAALCEDGDSVIINCGSTAFLLGQEICGRHVQVITNYFPLMNYLIEQDHDGLVILGGQYHRKRSLTIAPAMDKTFAYAGDYMFTSGKGLTADGLYKSDVLSSVAEQKMINQANKLIVLVDSSKVGKRIGTHFASAEQIDIIITGRDADPEVISQLERQDIEVILV